MSLKISCLKLSHNQAFFGKPILLPRETPLPFSYEIARNGPQVDGYTELL